MVRATDVAWGRLFVSVSCEVCLFYCISGTVIYLLYQVPA